MKQALATLALVAITLPASAGALYEVESSYDGAPTHAGIAVDGLKMKIPVVGGIFSKTAVARFARTLGTLLSAGVPILEALNITRETSGNAVFARALGKVHDGIREGESFADPLRQAKIVELRFFGGLTVAEVAEFLGVSKRTVEAEWTMIRAWLRRELSNEVDGD